MSETETKAIRRRLLILVCSFNEGGNLPRLFEQLQAVAPDSDLLLIDDGSTDETYAWLAENAGRFPRLIVKNRGSKLGLGTAIRDGLQFAIDQDYEFCLNLDADLSHDPAMIPRILEATKPQFDLVIGSRFVHGGGFSNCTWRRKLVSRTVNFLARRIIGWPIYDCSSAFRCYRIECIRHLDISMIENASYGFLEEILWKIWRAGGKIVEVPITYTEREQGVSKISLHEAKQTFGTLLRLNRFKR